MENEDWEAVAQIFQEGVNIKIATLHTEVPSYEAWDKTYTKNSRLVALSDGKVVGWTAIHPYSNRLVYSGVGEISIYLRSEYRRKGIGQKLLQALIDESEKQGYWTLQSSILEINKESIVLHEKLGFRTIGFRERIGKDSNGVWQNTVLMERRSKIIGQ